MDTTVADDDFSILYLFVFLGAFLCLPLLFIFCISVGIAHSRTREWQKTKARSSQPSAETEYLVKNNQNDSESDSELDPEDSGDEAELKLREEKRRDLTLTSREYFWKEMRRVWKGDQNVKYVQKAKERTDRRKLAKAVAKELVRMEKKRNGKLVPQGKQE